MITIVFFMKIIEQALITINVICDIEIWLTFRKTGQYTVKITSPKMIAIYYNDCGPKISYILI